MSVETITLGCRLNFAESETIARSRAGRTRTGSSSTAAPSPTKPCGRRARRSAARTANGRTPKSLSPAARPSWNPRPSRICRRCRALSGTARKLNSFAANDVMAPAGLLANVKSFVAVQNGCDHRCTFCSIWQARGPSVSLPSRRSAMPSPARSTAARRRSCSPASTSRITSGRARQALPTPACGRTSTDAPAPVVARQHRDR